MPPILAILINLVFFFILQILPTAQRLLDELLSSQSTAINTVCGAPGTAQKMKNDCSKHTLKAQAWCFLMISLKCYIRGYLIN